MYNHSHHERLCFVVNITSSGCVLGKHLAELKDFRNDGKLNKQEMGKQHI